MNKKETLNHLRMAKSAHIQWRSYAQAMIAGIEIEKDHVPVIHTDCKFGKWYYGSGQHLSSLPSYKAIETPHEMLHQIYMKIYQLLFSDKDERSALGKLFGSKAKVQRQKQEDAEVLMKKLLPISETLLEAIGMLEKEILDTSEEELSKLY